jgi:hypothetical protein
MSEILSRHPFVGEGDTELARLGRITTDLARDVDNLDLLEASVAITRYERCYRLAQLGLERLLWLARHHPRGAVPLHELKSDGVLGHVADQLPDATSDFARALDTASSNTFRKDIARLGDVRLFLEEAARMGEVPGLALVILKRHADVQHGKFDRGRRKMPWIGSVNAHIELTLARTGGLNREATSPDDIVPHPYRLASADALIAAGRSS